MNREEFDRIDIVVLRGTSDEEVERRSRIQRGLECRKKTVEVFHKKESLDNMVINLNKPMSRIKCNRAAK